jgi:hypothetical protein
MADTFIPEATRSLDAAANFLHGRAGAAPAVVVASVVTPAVVASLAGKANSISTIFSLDIYKKFFNKNATEKQMVGIGKWVVIVAMGIAALIAPALKNLDQAYQFIQEYVTNISRSGAFIKTSTRSFGDSATTVGWLCNFCWSARGFAAWQCCRARRRFMVVVSRRKRVRFPD